MVLRFEVFDGSKSLAWISLEQSGSVTLRLRDLAERDYIVEHFGGSAEDEGDAIRVRGDWTPLAFEIACLSLGRERGFAVVPRAAEQPLDG